MNAEEDFCQGTAMLADPAAAADWRHAVNLIEAAAASGFAPAIERRALFECMGVARAPDWGKAIQSLGEAAELGSEVARGQLLVLNDRPTTELLRSPEAKTLFADPIVRTIDGFASRAECQWLMNIAKPRLQRAIIHYAQTGEEGIDPGRTNRFALFGFSHQDVIVEMIRGRIANAIKAPLPCLEASQVLNYAPGEEFAPHHDFLDEKAMSEEIAMRGQRAVTALVYLNDQFEGGETAFPELGIEHRGKAGGALIFSNVDAMGRPDPRTRHAGCPPTSGEKWIFSQWVRDRIPA